MNISEEDLLDFVETHFGGSALKKVDEKLEMSKIEAAAAYTLGLLDGSFSRGEISEANYLIGINILNYTDAEKEDIRTSGSKRN